MEYRSLGNSGLKVPVLSLGTATFGGTNDFFSRWGKTDVQEAKRLVDICLERGVNFFDTADVYSIGDAEIILGKAIKNRRANTLIATKSTFQMGDGANDKGSSRHHILKACEASLKRLETDYIDVYFMHGFDATTPIEETLKALNHLVESGKVRYIGCSNFAAWQLMKSLSISEQNHLAKYVIYQGYYSLIGRDYEQELMPLLIDQNMGLMVWSPLGWGRLTGKINRNTKPESGRVQSGGLVGAPPVADELLYAIIDTLTTIADETEKSVSQVAINWLIQNPTVSNIIIGARNEEQLLDNLNATTWNLNSSQIERLNKVSEQQPIYPHWVGER